MLFELCMGLLSVLSLITLFCVIGCQISTTFTYFTKLFLVYIGIALCCLGSCVFGLFHSTWTTLKYSTKFLQPTLNLLDITFDIKLPENFEKCRSYIIVVNHQHLFDCCTVNFVSFFRYFQNLIKTRRTLHF